MLFRSLRATSNFRITDTGEDWVLGLSNRTLHAVGGRHAPDADATFRLERAALLAIVDGQATFADGIAAGSIEVTGDASAVDRIFTNLDTFLTNFPIVEP